MKAAQCICTITLCLGLAVLAACHRGASSGDEAGIRQWIGDFTKAFDARDSKSVMAFYVPDVVAFDIAPPLQFDGRDAYAKDYDSFFAGFKGPLALEYRDLRIQTSGDLAIVEGLERVTGTMINGQPADIWVRITTGLRKVNGKWLDFHDHVSVPVDLATGKAVMDLKP
jgi:ketosteroid isomerase-like protein